MSAQLRIKMRKLNLILGMLQVRMHRTIILTLHDNDALFVHFSLFEACHQVH